MDDKTQIHSEIMSFLSDYFKNTPQETIKKEIAEISIKAFSGSSAQDYFINFHSYYLNLEIQIPSNVYTKNHAVALSNKKSEKNKSLPLVIMANIPNSYLLNNRKQLEQELHKNNSNTVTGFGLNPNIQKNKYQYV